MNEEETKQVLSHLQQIDSKVVELSTLIRGSEDLEYKGVMERMGAIEAEQKLLKQNFDTFKDGYEASQIYRKGQMAAIALFVTGGGLAVVLFIVNAFAGGGAA